MSVIAFDTLSFSNKLKEAGMSPKLAEVQTEETAKIFNNLVIDSSITKKDLHELKFEVFAFTVVVAFFMVGILGALQALFHILK